MKKIVFLFLILLMTVPIKANADECWSVSKMKGYTAYADHDYEFSKDRIPNNITVCFGANVGTVTGTNTKLVKFGESTLAGYNTEKGIELFEVYQLDRVNNKVLYSKSRIGTKTAAPFLSDVIGSFVGEAKILPR